MIVSRDDSNEEGFGIPKFETRNLPRGHITLEAKLAAPRLNQRSIALTPNYFQHVAICLRDCSRMHDRPSYSQSN
jgi:hypothetical protein